MAPERERAGVAVEVGRREGGRERERDGRVHWRDDEEEWPEPRLVFVYFVWDFPCAARAPRPQLLQVRDGAAEEADTQDTAPRRAVDGGGGASAISRLIREPCQSSMPWDVF